MNYTNPIIPGFYPDPSICRVEQDYYLVNSSFEYFPGVPVFHSRDLVNWKQIGYCLTRPSQLPLEGVRASGGIFAPTIRFHNGLFYMVTTNVSQGGHFYVTASDPAGPWSEPVWLNTFGIDPSFFFDEDRKVYFTHTGPEGIYQSELDLQQGKPKHKPRMIWAGTGGAYPEGPHLYKINGMYYLMIAEGGTEYGHMITMARSNSSWGPFESNPSNPIVSNRSNRSPIQGTGHGDLFQDHLGNWWMVFLAFRPLGYPPAYNLGRETYLAPVIWNEAGWPEVNQGKMISLEMEGPLPDRKPWPSMPVRDDFNEAQPGLAWNYLRNPQLDNYSLTDRPGWLRLTGSERTLSEAASPTWLGRRQQHFTVQVSTQLDFDPQQEGEEAGLTAYMNPTHHYEVGVIRQDGQRQVIVRRRIGSLCAIVGQQKVSPGPVVLEIRADEEGYSFGCITASGDSLELSAARGERRYLCTETAGGFTGVYFALYASGNGQPAQTAAYFDWFDYQPSSV